MTIEAHVFPLTEGKRASRSADEVISALAQRQHGVVTRGQLLAAGVGGGAIEGRIASGILQPVHRGVYAIGHRALRREAWWVAAVLAAGPGAALSYRSAAELWVIRQSARARIEVSVPRHRRSTARLELHVVEMQPDEVIVEDGIRVTCPSRTLFDLASVLTIDQLEHAFNEAEYRRLSSPVSLDALLARYPKRRGTANLKRVLDNHRRNGQTKSRSVLERRFLRLVDAYGLPRPKINRLTEEGELDAIWPEQSLVVEVDGWAAHGTRKAFETDRARDRALLVAGWRVVRLTWRQLDEDGDAIAAQLATLLAQPPASSRPAHSSTARSWAS
jgi:very-short-patch-repair endonuclease